MDFCKYDGLIRFSIRGHFDQPIVLASVDLVAEHCCQCSIYFSVKNIATGTHRVFDHPGTIYMAFWQSSGTIAAVNVLGMQPLVGGRIGNFS